MDSVLSWLKIGGLRTWLVKEQIYHHEWSSIGRTGEGPHWKLVGCFSDNEDSLRLVNPRLCGRYDSSPDALEERYVIDYCS